MNQRRVDHVPRTRTAHLASIQIKTPTITEPAPTMPGVAGGSPIQLRGIPVVGGCAGAIPGTSPHHTIR